MVTYVCFDQTARLPEGFYGCAIFNRKKTANQKNYMLIESSCTPDYYVIIVMSVFLRANLSLIEFCPCTYRAKRGLEF